jgi:glycosyltransferase involved in cell wall biosynthesis
MKAELRIAMLLHPKMVREAFDPPNLETDSRGLTGSEVAFFRYARGLAARGHYVVCFSKFKEQALGFLQDAKLREEGVNAGVYCEPYDGGVRCEDWESTRDAQEGMWDACVAWTNAKPLFKASKSCFRVLNHQCNGFSASPPGWEEHVDLIAPLSNTHARQLASHTKFPRANFRLMPNGVDLEEFRPAEKVPGRMIWASSLDRGLHHLLGMMPAIRKAVPHAELHVFYDPFSVRWLVQEGDQPTDTPDVRELRQRSRYILAALEKMKGRGVVLRESVSRATMREEMAKAMILAYPLDPVYFTETFGVVVLEALACGTLPVLCWGDAFPELWKDASVGVEAPFLPRAKEYQDLLIATLRDPHETFGSTAVLREHAARHDWERLVPRFERCLLTRGEEGLEEVAW